MRTVGVFLLALSVGAGLAITSAPAAAKGKARKTARGGGDDAPAPAASGAEVNKLKAVSLGDPKAGFFKWGMKPEEVMALVRVSVEKKYEPRIKQAAQDPGKQQRIRDELNREINAVKKSYAKFEGDKSNWDVSIVGSEFQRNTGEAMLVTKDDLWTRYFFFFEDGLYKMFLAFNKDAIEGKSFQDFGKSMEARYGRAKEVYRDEKMKGGVRHILDHYEWAAGSDRLRLVDRSEFYGVYCLVLYEGNTHERLAERRKVVNSSGPEKDALVEAVTAKDDSGRDGNDNIIDRVTGHEVKKPGDEEKHADIVVPRPSKGGSPADVNTKTPASSPEKDSSSNKKKGKKSDNALDGLEL
jgi:hypothetical protein